MPQIKLDIKDCTECPEFRSKRHYTSDSFEMEFEQTCNKSNKRIAFVDATERQPAIPSWCELTD